MLQSLSIKNVALISSLSIDFGKGFNVLLGETGAGKSIIFDALNFVLGAKIDKTLLRTGESEMRVDAVFTDLNLNATAALKEFGYDDEDIAISRTYNAEGKSIIRVNGLPTSVSVLKEIGDILVNSYSQHESVDMLKTKNHLIMLDRMGGEKIKALKNDIKQLYSQLGEINKKIKALGGDDYERERKKSLLSYQIQEIEDANLQIGEDEKIGERLKLLNSAEKICQCINECEELLTENVSSCANSLQQASIALSGLLSFDKINECKERLDSARYEIEDICQTLVDIRDETDYDEEEFNEFDRRHDLIKSLIKKYGGSIEKTLDYLEESKAELDALNDSVNLIEKLEKEKKEITQKLNNEANKLTVARKEIAEEIRQKITNELRELGMKSSSFEVKFSLLDEVQSNGQDDVEFVFSANKGQELKSLSKTASGGELSRFMLAVKNIFAETGSAQTLIFDEIDAGISGETGNIVGQKLKNITKYAQVLCITHLPQVASYGDDFFYVSKMEDRETTTTSVEHLKGDDVIINLAKMVGGNNISDIALSHAKEMRDKAVNS